MKPSEVLLDKFFFFYCMSVDFTKLDKSTALPSLTKTVIGNLKILVPPLSEQFRIVQKLEELFVLLDAMLASLDS